MQLARGQKEVKNYWNFNSSNPCLYVGGNYNQNTNHGLFYVNRNSTSNANANIGCRNLLLLDSRPYKAQIIAHLLVKISQYKSELVLSYKSAGTFVQLKGDDKIKRANHLFEQIISEENLLKAINEVNKTHHWRGNHKVNKCTLRIECNKAKAVEDLRKILLEGFQAHKPHKRTIWDVSAQKQRTISEPAQWPDQYIHHALIQVLQSSMMKNMDFHCCGSIRGRGPLQAKKAIQGWMNKDKAGTKYVLSCDIYHFYEQLSPEVVMNRMKQLIKDYRTLDLIHEIIKDGIVIGYYTSQWFANTVLQPLDRLIRDSGYCKHYVRYIDNFTIFGSNKRKMVKLKKLIDTWLNEHHLKIKDNWQLFPVNKGRGRLPDAVGYRYGRDYVLLRKRNLLRIKRGINLFRKKKQQHRKISYLFAAGLLSRLGQLNHCNNRNIYQQLFNGEKIIRELKWYVRQHSREEKLKWENLVSERISYR